MSDSTRLGLGAGLARQARCLARLLPTPKIAKNKQNNNSTVMAGKTGGETGTGKDLPGRLDHKGGPDAWVAGTAPHKFEENDKSRLAVTRIKPPPEIIQILSWHKAICTM